MLAKIQLPFSSPQIHHLKMFLNDFKERVYKRDTHTETERERKTETERKARTFLIISKKTKRKRERDTH